MRDRAHSEAVCLNAQHNVAHFDAGLFRPGRPLNVFDKHTAFRFQIQT